MGKKSRLKRQRIVRKTEPASLTLKIFSWLCLVIGLTATIWGITEFRHIDNTIDGVGFFIQYSFLGVLLSVPLYILMYRTIPDLKNRKRVDKQWTSNLFGLGMGFFFLTPGMASYINRTHLIGQATCKEYTIDRKGSSGGRYLEYHIFVQIQDHEERLTVFKPYWETLSEGQLIRLCFKKEFWAMSTSNYETEAYLQYQLCKSRLKC